MSTVGVDRFLYRAKVDAAFRRRFAEAPDDVLDDYSLTDDERRFIRNKDVGSLLRRGAHPLLLRRWAGFIGIDYHESLRAAGIDADWVPPRPDHRRSAPA